MLLVLAALVAAALLVLASTLGLFRRRLALPGASQSLLPLVGSRGSSIFGSRTSLHALDGQRERACLPCTCDCGSPMCEPSPCSRSAAAEAAKQLAELERAFARDERVDELLRLAAENPPSGLMYVPDRCLFARKLIVTCGTARASLALLESACAFREHHRVDEALRMSLPEPFRRQIRAVVPHGLHKTDRWGHPLYIERVGQIEPKLMAELWAAGADPLSLPPHAREPRAAPGGGKDGGDDGKAFNAAVLYHFQMVEFARLEYAAQGALHGRRVSKMASILDLSGLRLTLFASKACLERLGGLSRMGDLLTVENLAAIYVVNAPWFFAKCWQAVSHVLVPRTAEKIRVLAPGETAAFLRTVVPAENLPCWLGGTCDCAGGCVSADGQPSAAQAKSDAQIEAWGAAAAALRPAAAVGRRLAPRAAQGGAFSLLLAWLRSAPLLRCFAQPAPGARSPGGAARPDGAADVAALEEGGWGARPEGEAPRGPKPPPTLPVAAVELAGGHRPRAAPRAEAGARGHEGGEHDGQLNGGVEV